LDLQHAGRFAEFAPWVFVSTLLTPVTVVTVVTVVAIVAIVTGSFPPGAGSAIATSTAASPSGRG